MLDEQDGQGFSDTELFTVINDIKLHVGRLFQSIFEFLDFSIRDFGQAHALGYLNTYISQHQMRRWLWRLQ